jgi:hypothetical protein
VYCYRCGNKKLGDREKKYVHMLNATLCATGRAICCLLETYQEKDGVRIPDVLVPFMGGLTFLPFVRDSKLAETVNEKPKNPPKAATAIAIATAAHPPAPPAAAAAPAAAVASPEVVALTSSIAEQGEKVRAAKTAKVLQWLFRNST